MERVNVFFFLNPLAMSLSRDTIYINEQFQPDQHRNAHKQENASFTM